MSNVKSSTAQKMTVRMSLHELELPENSKKKNNFLKAWKRIKELPPSNPNSFWSIGTFHGMPYKNDHQTHTENTPVWRSYCQHNSVLFLTWHRFYCLRLEQALQTVVPEDEQGENGGVALHYWDYLDQSKDPLPPLLVHDTVIIDGKEEPNPLMDYVMPLPLEGYLPDTSYIKPEPGYRTVRYPFSGIYNPESAKKAAYEHNGYILSLPKKPIELFRENFEAWLNYGLIFDGKSTGHSLYFDAKQSLDNPEFNSFSNRSSSEYRLGDAWKSVETVHDTVHLAIGGYTFPNVDPLTGQLDYYGLIQGSNGDMGENETASFDPSFFLHHCNVDRLFWVWQKKWNQTDDIQIDYSDPKDPGLTPAGGQGPSLYQKADQVLDLDTVLLPFQDELGVIRTSRDCINIEKQLNFTYSIGSFDRKDWDPVDRYKQPVTEYHKPIELCVTLQNMHIMEDSLKAAMAMAPPNEGSTSERGRVKEEEESESKRLHRFVLDITALIQHEGSEIGDLSPLLTTGSPLINILDGKTFTKKLHLVICNINSDEFKGSFVVFLTQKIPGGQNDGQWKLVGQSGVLSRWEISFCDNCVHRKGKTVSFEINYSHTNHGQVRKEDLQAFVVTKDPEKHVKKITQLELFSQDEAKPKTQLIVKAVEVVERVGLKRKAEKMSIG